MLDRSHRIGCSSGHVFHQIGSSSSYFKQELRIKYIEPEEHISYTSALNTYAAELIEVKVTSKTTLTLHQHTICQILPAALPPLAQESRTATGKLIHFLIQTGTL